MGVASNTLSNTGGSALLLNGAGYDANDLSGSPSFDLTGNLISRAGAWPGGETAVQLGPNLPQALRDFRPAAVTAVDGQRVSGSSGVNSPCPSCKIEVFLDDRDNFAEALESLAILQADPNGEWEIILERPLTQEEGLRTMSTTTTPDVIPGLGAGTSTGLSQLYIPAKDEVASYLPVVSSPR